MNSFGKKLEWLIVAIFVAIQNFLLLNAQNLAEGVLYNVLFAGFVFLFVWAAFQGLLTTKHLIVMIVAETASRALHRASVITILGYVVSLMLKWPQLLLGVMGIALVASAILTTIIFSDWTLDQLKK